MTADRRRVADAAAAEVAVAVVVRVRDPAVVHDLAVRGVIDLPRAPVDENGRTVVHKKIWRFHSRPPNPLLLRPSSQPQYQWSAIT